MQYIWISTYGVNNQGELFTLPWTHQVLSWCFIIFAFTVPSISRVLPLPLLGLKFEEPVLFLKNYFGCAGCSQQTSLQHAASRLCCSTQTSLAEGMGLVVARRILVPQPGIEPVLPALEAPGKSLEEPLLMLCSFWNLLNFSRLFSRLVAPMPFLFLSKLPQNSVGVPLKCLLNSTLIICLPALRTGSMSLSKSQHLHLPHHY